MAKSKNKKVAKTGTKSKGNVPPSLTAQQIAAIVKAGGMVFSSADMKKLKKKYKGDPVAVATGEVVDDAVDLIFPSVLPMAWIRIYGSFMAREATPLGRGGWTHSFHQWIEVRSDATVLRIDTGEDVRFPVIRSGESAYHRGRRLTLSCFGEDRFEVKDHTERLVREYGVPKGAAAGRAMLIAVRDPWGNRQELVYEAGALRRVVDPSGRELSITSDSKGRVVTVDAVVKGKTEQTFTYAYTEEGELGRATDALGYSQSYLYDGHHRMVKKTLANGFSLHYEYDPVGGQCVRTWGDGGLYTVDLVFDADRKQTTTSGNPEPAVFTWNDAGEVVRTETFDGEFVDEVVYDDDLLIVENRDAAGRVLKVEYDERGHRIKSVGPMGNTTEWDYQDDLPIRETEDGELVREMRYDARGTLVEVREASGAGYLFDHDAYGRLVQVSTKNGLVVRYRYDEAHNLIEETDARSGVRRHAYDPLGFPISETDRAGRTVRFEYDVLRRLTKTIFPDGTTESYAYGPLGLPVEQVSPAGEVTRLEYIGTGKLSRLIRADGQKWQYTYDRNERLITIENPKAEVYEFRYDARGLLVEERPFDGRVITYEHSRVGALARIELPDGSYQAYRRDLLGRLLELKTPDSVVRYVRDKRGRIVEAVAQDAAGRVETKLDYDERGYLIAVTQDGRTIRYEVDDFGKDVSRTMPGGQVTRYYYDAEEALVGLDHQGHKVLLQRDLTGAEVRRHLYDAGMDVLSRYDDMGRLAQRGVVAPAAPGQRPRTLLDRRWSYGPLGRLAAHVDGRFGQTEYRYDGLGRLAEERRAASSRAFEYDIVGSLTGIHENGNVSTPWTLGRGDVLLRTPNALFENDILRHRKSKVRCRDHRPTGERTEYSWDALGRLRQVILPSGERVRFFYDAFGRRVRKEIHPPDGPPPLGEPPRMVPPPRTVEYLWDGNVLAAEIDSARGTRVYACIPEHFTPVLHEDDGRVLYYVTDMLGTPKDLLDATGAVVWSAQHGPRGEILETRRTGDADTPLRWPGVYEDAETGLFYVRFRYADPEVGRWLSPDPLGFFGHPALFEFQTIDPLGLGVDPTPTPYGTDPLQPAVDAFRAANPQVTPGRNVAAMQVGDHVVVMPSQDGVHSERRIFGQTGTGGVTGAFTELEPCSGHGMNGCKDACNGLGKSRTSWSFEYPEAPDPNKAPVKAQKARARRRAAVREKRKAVRARMKKFGVTI